MRARGVMLLVLVLVLVAMPAAAEPAPQVTDTCGDAGTNGEWNGDEIELEENRPHLDLRSGSVGGIYAGGAFDGFTAAITVCGEASAAEGGYNLTWGYGDGCYGHVTWTMAGRNIPDDEGASGQIQAAAGQQGVVTEVCYRERETPLDDGVETVYRATLPDEAVVFEGDTLTFTVARADLPEAAAPRLVAGTQWENISAISMDQGPSMWGRYADTEGNRGELTVRTDFALGDGSYTVGEDAR